MSAILPILVTIGVGGLLYRARNGQNPFAPVFGDPLAKAPELGSGPMPTFVMGQDVRSPSAAVFAVLPIPTVQRLYQAAGAPDNRVENVYVRVLEVEPGTGRIRGQITGYDFAGPGRAGSRQLPSSDLMEIIVTPFYDPTGSRAV